MIWDAEIVKADGHLYAFVRIQNEFTGNISGSFRRIYKDKNGYYAKVDGSNHYFNHEVEVFQRNNDLVSEAKTFFKKYGQMKGGYTWH